MMKAMGGEALAQLTFADLREANIARLPLFKNRRGQPAHSQPDGSDWALSAWCNAVTGELGELANLIKKVERGDFTLDEARADIGRELADVQTYLDILAFRAGLDLGAVTIQKWNEVSDRIGCGLRLVAGGEGPPSEPQAALALFDELRRRAAAGELDGAHAELRAVLKSLDARA